MTESEGDAAERPTSLWRRSRPLTLLLSLSAFAACVFYVLTRFQWRAAIEYLSRVDYVELVVVIGVVHLGCILLRTWRSKMMLSRPNPGLRVPNLYRITAIIEAGSE